MSYNLENPKELYEFSQACEDACCCCPQYRPWNPIDFDEDRNEVSPFEVFIWWKENDGGRYLFNLGYCAELDEEALSTFNQYTVRQNFNEEGKEIESDIIDLSTGKLLSKKPIQILKFC
jgi:hypothetical protein